MTRDERLRLMYPKATPSTPSREELEAIHGVCGNGGCEAKLIDGRCPRCDA